MDLHNLFHFLDLRTSPLAQKEIRDYATVISEIVRKVCPIAHEAFLDYRKNAMNLSQQEIRVLARASDIRMPSQKDLDGIDLSSREITELKDKLTEPDIENTSNRLYRLLSPGTAVGGGPLWGVNGIVAVAHGSSHAPQITGAINQAKLAVESGFVQQLATELEKVKGRISTS